MSTNSNSHDESCLIANKNVDYFQRYNLLDDISLGAFLRNNVPNAPNALLEDTVADYIYIELNAHRCRVQTL